MHFPDPRVRLAIQGDNVAIVEGGLRLSEEELLSAGQPERFPILVEVANPADFGSPRIVEHRHVIRLVFRTREEADAFRFRPVDEFDTEVFECQVDEQCFGLGGPPRFALRVDSISVAMRTGHLVDRIVAGVHFMVLLGGTSPPCREHALQFLSGGIAKDNESSEIGLATSILAMFDARSKCLPRQLRGVIGAFSDAEDHAPRRLVDDISRNLHELATGDSQAEAIETRWIEVAMGVVRNRVVLDGALLSDDRSVLLRAALLALIVDNVEAIGTFLGADKPSGPRVTSIAAFLVGLKHGLIATSWKWKGRWASELSIAAAEVMRALLESPMRAEGLVSITQGEDESWTNTTLSIGEAKLAEWREEKKKVPDAVEDAWLADFNRLGYEVVGKGKSRYSWLVNFPGVRTIEVRHCAIGNMRFPMLCLNFAHGQKLRSVKEINSIFGKGGRLWHPRAEEPRKLALICELHSLPSHDDAGVVVEALREAIDLCLAKEQPIRKPTGARKPARPTSLSAP